MALVVAGLSAAAAPRPTVLGVSWEGSGMLARLDARTLAPVGRRLDIGKAPTDLVARSPDGRTIALGHGSIAELRFVDVRTMRASGRVRLGTLGSVLAAIWPSPVRLVAVRGGETPEVVIVDPRARRILTRRPLEGEVMGAVAVKGRLVALLAPERTIGQARLAVVGPEGSVGIVVLPGVAAGFTPPKNEQETGRQASPGVAVESTGTRAAVATPETLLLINLDGLAVTRLLHLKERAPARAGKLIEGWGRRAIWVRSDTVAVSGWRYSVEGKQLTQSTIGVELVDVLTGESRFLDATAKWVERVGDTLLTFGGVALRGYRLDGTLRFELLAGQDTGYVQTSGRFVYVGSENSTRFTVVDVLASRVLGTTRTPYPTIVFG